MAREKTKDLISQMIPQTTHEQPTETPQKTHESTTDTPQRGAMEKYNIRMLPTDWEALKRHFEAKGLTISAGLRMVLKEYMSKEQIR
jgi:hypothetical protein